MKTERDRALVPTSYFFFLLTFAMVVPARHFLDPGLDPCRPGRAQAVLSFYRLSTTWLVRVALTGAGVSGVSMMDLPIPLPDPAPLEFRAMPVRDAG